jgi:hypothetical protein
MKIEQRHASFGSGKEQIPVGALQVGPVDAVDCDQAIRTLLNTSIVNHWNTALSSAIQILK